MPKIAKIGKKGYVVYNVLEIAKTIFLGVKYNDKKYFTPSFYFGTCT